MISAYRLLRPLIHSLPPETAHHLALWMLRHRLLPSAPPLRLPELTCHAFGLTFQNPVGLAAGFDKNAVAVNALLAQGFGFVETGTVTPRAQQGNPPPRIFRLEEDEAVINRLGFNNNGLKAYLSHFCRRDRNRGIAGANIGKNKDSEDAVVDYALGLRAVYPHADYVTVNISSPNTQGLRDLQQKEALERLFAALDAIRGHCVDQYGTNVPLLLKVAPDLEDREMRDIVDAVLEFGIDGLIIGNTTISRPDSLRSAYRNETGGLSGKPLYALSTAVLKKFYVLIQGRIPIIGVGGIASAQDAYMKIRAGATLVQLYTALVYQGFSLVNDINKGLAELLRRDGFANVEKAIGVDAMKV